MKKIICLVAAFVMLTGASAFAMSTTTFDNGMRKGIEYFNKGLYYEAKDEFTWFKNAHYNEMNYGQQKYLSDYLNGTNNRITQWENSLASSNTSSSSSSSSITTTEDVDRLTNGIADILFRYAVGM